MESIEKNAFAYCFELDELVLPDGVRLETDSFRHDKGLKKICISSNTININKDKKIFASDGSDYYTFDRENEATRNEQFEKALSFSSAN